jgi:prolipoprotein diacylglyceryltransferase
VCAGVERLLVEMIRLNPTYLGLSQAQWISVGMIILGSLMIARLRSNPADTIEAPKPRSRRPESPARQRAAR